MIRHKLPKYAHRYPDRYGRERIYLRMPGRPQVALPVPLFSEAFWIAYHKAMAGAVEPAPQTGAARTKPGTMNALIAAYYQSSAFTARAPSTQRTYRSQIEEFRKDHGDDPVASLKAKHIDAILGKVAKGSTAQAHKLRKRLLKLMKLAVTWGYREDNPVLVADRIDHKEKGYRTWTEDDIQRYRQHWKKGTPQRIALEVLLNTGLRRSDAVRLGKQHRQGIFHVIAVRKNRETVNAIIPVNNTLETHLASVPAGCLTYIVTERRIGRSEKAFTNWIIDAARAAGLPPRSSPHGLRKAMCRRLADSGCTSAQIAAITGQSIVVIERYIKEYNREKAAQTAMTSLENAFDENEAQTKIG